uniref:Putative transcriptional regulator n=1 Tax=uncultured bacterium esnapd2 TaxID=1366601 RepID=S5TLV8_9BACT|nr:putative transcriptional regulator [uncultured bacterium esnapd2]
MGEGRLRTRTANFFLAWVQRRRYYAIVAAALVVVVVVLLLYSRPLEHYGMNLSLNLGADLIGTIVVLFLIAPFLTRADRLNEAVLDRFNHRAFIRQAASARHRVMVMELWTDLLQGGYQDEFLAAVREVLSRKVEVRILLLDPDARAAEQRADDLLQQTDVVNNILDNLRVLHEFRRDLPEHFRHYLDVRIYSALPPVQMYRVDDHVIVSFFPVNMTSWNAAQYQTSPQAQLGQFVGTKFDELWEARSTRWLDQFWTLTLEDRNERYEARFVHVDEQVYVGGRKIVERNLRGGIDGLPVRIVNDNAKGEVHRSKPYLLTPLDHTSPDLAMALDAFNRKYGHTHQDVILKLTVSAQ